MDKYATSALNSLNVKIRLSTTVLNTILNSKLSQEGHLEGSPVNLSTQPCDLQLSTGSTLTADLYIPAFGLTPNTSFLSAEFLTADNLIAVNANLNIPNHSEVWALGDVCNVEGMQLIHCDKQSSYVARTITTLLRGKTINPYKVATSREFHPSHRDEESR